MKTERSSSESLRVPSQRPEERQVHAARRPAFFHEHRRAAPRDISDLVELQRLAGNRAVTGLLSGARGPGAIAAGGRGRRADPRSIAPETREARRALGPPILGRRPEVVPIQRVLPAATKYSVVAGAVGTAVDDYNNLAVPKTASDYQAAFRALQKVERAVHGWFDQFTGANQKFGHDANVTLMNDLLDKVESEHTSMIDQSKDLTDVLPFDTTGLPDKVVTDMKAIWQDIVNNRGKIQLIGSAAFNRQALSHLGRILSTPTGRQMLQFLNSSPAKGYKKGETPELTNIYIGEKVSQLPSKVRDQSPDLADRDRAEAQPLNISEGGGRSVESMTAVSSTKPFFKPNSDDYPTVDASDISVIRNALMGGKKGFVYNGKKYTFNEKRTGAFVTNVKDASLHPGKGTGNQILSPTWVTLAHELGHAANMRGGGTTLKANELSGLGGSGPEAEKWDNPEELLNIENIENAIRREAGLTERFGHRPPDWLLQVAPKVRTQLKKPLDELFKLDRVRYNFEDPEWSNMYKKVNTLKARNACDPELLEPVIKELKKWLDDNTDDSTGLKLHSKAIQIYDAAVVEVGTLLSA